MLYPTTVIADAEPGDTHVIPNSNLAVFPFSLEADDAINIIIVHTAGTANQDHSLRSWVSTEIGGAQIYSAPAHVQVWHPNRNGLEIVTAYDADRETVPDTPFALALAPGDYYVCVLNLSNAENVFTFELTDFE